MHDSVYDLAGDDPRMAKLLRLSLAELADGPDGPLKEMAHGVLAGHVDLRRAAMSGVPDDEFSSAFSGFWTEWENLDDDERAHRVVSAEHQLDDLLDGPSPATPS